MHRNIISSFSTVISTEIREVYNGSYLPSIADALKKIGLENVRMPRIGAGFSSDVFDTGYGQVLKITNKEIADENGIRPVSRYVLQPVCTMNLNCLYEVALYPKLTTSGVTHIHSEVLKVMLETEGYILFDSKILNIGLSPLRLGHTRVPYVIDPDAICYQSNAKRADILTHCAKMFKWPTDQWSIFPCIVKGSSRKLTQDSIGEWQLSESYGQKATVTEPNRLR